MQVCDIFTAKRLWLIELGFRKNFLLKHFRFLTAAIFIGSTSMVQKSFTTNVTGTRLLQFSPNSTLLVRDPQCEVRFIHFY